MKLSWIFKWYLNSMSFFGKLFEPITLQAKAPDKAGVYAPLLDEHRLSLSEADEIATSLGMRYRALGVSIGIMGIAIIFLAIAPSGLGMGHHAEEIVGGIKVILMVLMLYLVFSGRRSRINHEWIRMRLVAEKLRYCRLQTLADAAPDADPKWAEQLRAQLEDVLIGKGGQIAYNAAKAHQYESVERFADILLWASVILALIGAVGHFFVSWPAFIFLTAFGPAAAGGIHGINGFLGIGGLIDEHTATQIRLQLSLERLRNLAPLDDQDGKALKDIATAVLEILGSRDSRWKESAAKLGLKPA